MKDLTHWHWAPLRRDPLDFSERIAILACHLEALIEQGPHVEIRWRFGAHQWQSLRDALAHTEYCTLGLIRFDGHP
ncbi:hypothetical protein AB0442_40920 [Kitasatospora sp. NPDC085895]|uniref:hypothetical protein n=1 Tax=Kitasatospora sp. NPDC085895 TaxID=3155057 RepID=UPI00344E8053